MTGFCFAAVGALFGASLVLAKDTITCPPDYMAVTRYGREQCNQRIWKGFELSYGVPKKFSLPIFQEEGWTDWKMCLNGTMGPSEMKFAIKFLAIDDPLASVTVNYRKQTDKFIFREYQDAVRVTKDTRSDSSVNIATGEPIKVTAAILDNTLEYAICGQTGACFTQQRNMLETNQLRHVELNFQASITVLDLWCL